MMSLKRASMEREQKMNEYMEKNCTNNSQSKFNKREKYNEIFSAKKEIADEVKSQRY